LGQKTAVLNVDMPMRFQFSAWNVPKLPSCCYVMEIWIPKVRRPLSVTHIFFSREII